MLNVRNLKNDLLFLLIYGRIKSVEKYTHKWSIKLVLEIVALYEEVCGGLKQKGGN